MLKNYIKNYKKSLISDTVKAYFDKTCIFPLFDLKIEILGCLEIKTIAVKANFIRLCCRHHYDVKVIHGFGFQLQETQIFNNIILNR